MAVVGHGGSIKVPDRQRLEIYAFDTPQVDVYLRTESSLPVPAGETLNPTVVAEVVLEDARAINCHLAN